MNQSEPFHIVLAGGGTAGHINPLLSIAQQIKKIDPDTAISVIGTNEGLETRLVPSAGFELDTIDKVPFPRSVNKNLFTFPFRFMRQLQSVRMILKKRRCDVLVGVGGYASAPAYVQAHFMKIPIIVHEQNARAGMANKLGSKWASFIGLTYAGCGLKPSHHARMERVGLPLRQLISQQVQAIITDRESARRHAAICLGLDPDLPIIAVTGGSLGAVNINSAVANASRELLEVAQIIHLTGKAKSSSVRSVVSALAGDDNIASLGQQTCADYRIAEYWEHMDTVMTAADLVICRSGAGTVAELTALGTPAIYVPLAIGNGEQVYNAQPVVDNGGGIIVRDRDFTADWIIRNVIPLIQDKKRLEHMSTQAWNYGKRDAAEKMAHIVLDIARNNRQRYA